MIDTKIKTYGTCKHCEKEFLTTDLSLLPETEKYFKSLKGGFVRPGYKLDYKTLLCPECMDEWLAANP